jgi:hypothetical protein
MSFYTNVAGRAYRAIKKRGAAMILRRTIAGTINPNTGLMDVETVTDYPCYGLIQYFDSKASALMYGTNTLKESLINAEDQMIMLAVLDSNIIPTQVTDALVLDSTTFTIVNLLTLKPGGEDIIHNVHVRK